MKFYTYPTAPSPLRVELMLKYKGVSLDRQTIDMRKGEHMQPPFSTINPRCTLPALVTDDGNCLSEVIAICIYLDSQFPEKSVFGTNDLERAQVVNWMHRIFTDGFMAAAEALRNSSPGMKDRALPGPENIAQIPELAERGLKRLNLFMRGMDSHLKGRQFFVGTALTQADIDAYVILNFAGWVKVTPSPEHMALLDWKQRMDGLLA